MSTVEIYPFSKEAVKQKLMPNKRFALLREAKFMYERIKEYFD